MKASVKTPPTRHAMAPNSKGAPDRKLAASTPWDWSVTPYCSCRYVGSQVMLKYQPYEAQKYIRHSAHRFALVSRRPHGTPACPAGAGGEGAASGGGSAGTSPAAAGGAGAGSWPKA